MFFLAEKLMGRQSAKRCRQTGKSQQQFGGRKHRWQDGGKTDTRMDNVFRCRDMRGAEAVIPVLHKTIQVFKIPPEQRTGRKQYQKKTGPGTEQAGPLSPADQAIDHQNIAGPEGEKSIALQGLKERKPVPGQNPEKQGNSSTGPPPPGKRTGVFRSHSLV